MATTPPPIPPPKPPKPSKLPTEFSESKPWNGSDSDRADLEEFLEERRHHRWLGNLLFRWAKWITAVALGVTVIWDWLIRIVKQAGSS